MQRLAWGLLAAISLSACSEQTPETDPGSLPAPVVASEPAPAGEPAPAVEPDSLGLGSSWKFASGSKGAGALINGWSGAEPWGVWSMEKKATLTLPIDPALDGKALDLEFDTQAFVNDKVPEQIVTVTVAGAPVGEWRYGLPFAQGVKQKITVPAAAREAGAPLTVEFSLPNATSPKAIGQSEDLRTLALGVYSVSVTAAN